MRCTHWCELPTRPRNRLGLIWAKLANIDTKAAIDVLGALKSMNYENRMIPIELREAIDNVNDKHDDTSYC